jgi:hypothetical protein
LPKCGAVKIEEFADAALGLFNLAVYPVSGQVDKERRDFGQQRLKLQPLFQDLLYPLALGHFRLHPFVSLLQALLRDSKPRSKVFYLKGKLLICFTALMHCVAFSGLLSILNVSWVTLTAIRKGRRRSEKLRRELLISSALIPFPA